MHGDARTYELVGGPMDGELRTLPAGSGELELSALPAGFHAAMYLPHTWPPEPVRHLRGSYRAAEFRSQRTGRTEIVLTWRGWW